MSDKPSFFAELQRRNVYKVGAMYAVAGWLVVQVVTQVFPIFHVSELIQRVIVLAIVAGFPLALVLSWIYELTPQGIVKTGEVTADASITARTGQRLNRAIIGVLSLAVLVLLARQLWPHAATPADAPAATAAAAASDKSIAVLPFENLSDDKANAYFATGVQDQVLTQLAKIGALRVISRTSTEQYAAKPPSVAEIAKQLGVAHILEGSVQKAGDSVRINVQLIRADGDRHLWAETYDRRLDDIFGVESEVAGAIAQALNARLSGFEQQELAARPTRNGAAWDAYLHGLVLYNRGEWRTDMDEAERSLREAVRLDPDFALAWALLSEVHGSQVIELWDSSDRRRDAAREAVRQAVRLKPEAQETRIAQAYCEFWVERDYAAARRIFEQVRQQAPNNADVAVALAFVARRQGRWDDSLVAFEQAASLDPRNVETLTQAALTAAATGRYDAAQHYLDRAEDAAPQISAVLVMRAQIALMRGQLDQAGRLLAQAAPDGSEEIPAMALAAQYLLQRRYAEGAVQMRHLLGTQGPAQAHALYGFYLADFQRLSGDAKNAAAGYGQALDQVNAALKDQPQNIYALDIKALLLARLGRKAEALATIGLARQALPAGGDALFGSGILNTQAHVQAQSGDRDATLASLQQLAAEPNVGDSAKPPVTPATLRLDPDWDALREDPRFQRLLTDVAANGVEPPKK